MAFVVAQSLPTIVSTAHSRWIYNIWICKMSICVNNNENLIGMFVTEGLNWIYLLHRWSTANTTSPNIYTNFKVSASFLAGVFRIFVVIDWFMVWFLVYYVCARVCSLEALYSITFLNSGEFWWIQHYQHHQHNKCLQHPKNLQRTRFGESGLLINRWFRNTINWIIVSLIPLNHRMINRRILAIIWTRLLVVMDQID